MARTLPLAVIVHRLVAFPSGRLRGPVEHAVVAPRLDITERAVVRNAVRVDPGLSGQPGRLRAKEPAEPVTVR